MKPERKNSIIRALAISSVVLILAYGLLAKFTGRGNYTGLRPRSDCINQLKQIDEAKQQWAIDNRKSRADIPAKSDLYGPSLYFKVEPICVNGGVYTLGAVGEKPTCSLAETDGHIL